MDGLWAEVLINIVRDNKQKLLFKASNMKRERCKTYKQTTRGSLTENKAMNSLSWRRRLGWVRVVYSD